MGDAGEGTREHSVSQSVCCGAHARWIITWIRMVPTKAY
ncbi:hypothetical protein SynTAK9802_02247 [Synechococcus sp. TAK9802]|nr:hypothetical protein SynTAK9802_02247 [Synechococcus sp. TAK9802]